MFQSLHKPFFSILALFCIGTAAFVSLDMFRGYQAEVSVLVLPTTESMNVADQMVENIAILPTTLSFFDALLASDNRLTEFSSLDEESIDARSANWKNMLSVERHGESGVITYRIQTNNREEAMIFARQMTTVLFQKVGMYYDIRSDISIRLIESPVVRASISQPFFWIASSLMVGMLLALCVTLLFSLIRFGSYTVTTQLQKNSTPFSDEISMVARSTETALPTFRPDTFVPKKPTVLFSEEGEARARAEKQREPINLSPHPLIEPVVQQKEDVTQDVPKKTPDVSMPSSAFVRAEAPSNLPFIDEAAFLAQFSGSNTEEVSPAPVHEEPVGDTLVNEKTPSLSEPTIEEYRRRLNALLKEDH